jgi:hypothetical protein
MAKRRIKRKRKKSNRKIRENSSYAPLCALSALIESRSIFDCIHEMVEIPQKEVDYRPTDKLVFVVVGIMSGCQVMFDLNRKLRVDRVLLRTFGYQKCADQSVIQRTIDASTRDNVQQLESALKAIWDNHNMTVPLLENACKEGRVETIDMDLSGMPASRKAEGSKKGYFAGKRNIHGRQLARILIPKTQEIVAESLYPGNMKSCVVFKSMVERMEQQLSLSTKSQRQLIRLRLDGGFGTDENINYALWRGYHLLAKVYSWKRARALARSVHEWVDISPGPDNRPRQAGWVSQPYRYGSKTKQLAIRMPKKKGKGHQYSVLVITDMDADLHSTVDDYDGRSGVPESTFCQDNQGLGMRKRRKKLFAAQQMLMLLNQLAHNLIRWIQHWMIKAMKLLSLAKSSQVSWWTPSGNDTPEDSDTASETLSSFGMKRLVSQVLCLSGEVTVKKGKVTQIKLNPLYPMITRIRTGLDALLRSYGITVSLHEI